MRILVQRVLNASVSINNDLFSSIDKGLLIFAGIENDDNEEDIAWLSNKICGLRIFDDPDGVMNLSVRDIDGNILAVSQFTLHARIKKGFRPSYIDAAPPERSVPIYEKFVNQLEIDLGKKVFRGEFGAEMNVALVNHGPVTIFIDSKNKR